MDTVDRAIRVLVALVVIVLFYTKVISGTLAVVLLLLSTVFVLTSLISFCPLYIPFGINTCKKK